jgi:hypothetical protein
MAATPNRDTAELLARTSRAERLAGYAHVVEPGAPVLLHSGEVEASEDYRARIHHRLTAA